MDDLISVVIPAYNASEFIGSAIQSVLDQSYKNVEIIVVDDCSTDDTADKLLAFHDKIRVLRHEKNKGAAEARNTGVGQCRGRLVAFLDGDDKWVPGKLEVFAEAFSRNEDILFAFSDFSRFRWEDGTFFSLTNSQIVPIIYKNIELHRYIDYKFFVIPRKDMFTMLLRGYPIYPSSVVVRKQIFELTGIWRKVRTNEDLDFNLRSSRVTDCIYIDESLSLIGRHDTNLTIDILRHVEGDLSVFDLHLTDTSYKKDELDLIKYFKGRRLCGLGYSYLHSGNSHQAFRKYKEALGYRKWFWHALLKIVYVAFTGFRRGRIPQT